MRYAIIAYDNLYKCQHKQYVATVVDVNSEYEATNKGFDLSYDFIINNPKIFKELLTRAQEAAYGDGIDEEFKLLAEDDTQWKIYEIDESKAKSVTTNSLNDLINTVSIEEFITKYCKEAAA